MKKSVNIVLTTKEAFNEFIGVADCAIRQWIDQKLLGDGRTWIMDRIVFMNLLRKKKLPGKVFEIDEKEVTFEYLGLKSKALDIWYENEHVRDVLTKMPYANAVSEAFLAYKEDSGLKYKHLLITDDSEVSDNWFYRKSKTWVVTLRYVLETISKTLEAKGIETMSLEQFLKEKNM
ncbi:hypothetical protein ACFVS2_21580 [Brevibacillus sp. NPDC058079]|uniref:hypothetical protein n=1 Tax=Brevibacillus sp. NPDC058079 TaxID=3346330 RepID=UPI0036E30674